MFKIIITIKDVLKPVVFTCYEEKEHIITKIKNYLNSKESDISFSDNDIFLCNDKSNIRSIVITKAG